MMRDRSGRQVMLRDGILPFTRQSLFNLRQARHHDVADDLQALRRNFIEGVVFSVPVLVSAELNNIERIYAGAQERFMIVAADAFARIDKN